MPTHEECYWAMLALNALDNLNRKRLMDLCRDLLDEKPSIKHRAEYKQKACFDTIKVALNKSPKDWLGPEHDPATEECQRWRRIFKNILNHVTKVDGKEVKE